MLVSCWAHVDRRCTACAISSRSRGGHAVQLALGLLVAAAVGGAALGGLGVDAFREGLAAVPFAAHGLRGFPGQVVPNSGGLLVPKPIFAVAHVAAASEGPSAGSPWPTIGAVGCR